MIEWRWCNNARAFDGSGGGGGGGGGGHDIDDDNDEACRNATLPNRTVKPEC